MLSMLRTTEISLCYVSGEPHYVTFDKMKIDYQGLCKHKLCEPSSDYTGPNMFHVYLRNEYRGSSTAVSFPQAVIVDACEHHIEITHDPASLAAVPVIVTVSAHPCV